MSDDNDVNPGRNRRKYNALVGDNSDSSIEATTKRKRRKYKNYVRESDTESDSSVEVLQKKKRVHRLVSDSDGSSSGSSIKKKKTKNVTALHIESDASSSGSEVIRTKKTLTALVTDSESDGNESDSEYDSDWVTEPEPENNCKPPNDESKSNKHIGDDDTSSDSSDGQTERCPICLLPFKSQEIASPESCDHCFCVDCIIEWSKNVNTCPVDRQTFNLILVRRNFDGKVIKQIPIESPQQQNEVDEIVEDPTFCEICGRCDREDRMLLCDGCDLGYHLDCLTPPLENIPAGAWFCTDCGPELRVDDPMIDIFEVHLLLEDAETLGWPNGPRRRNTTAPRLVPRTRQSERVRARIITHRNQRRDDTHHEHSETFQSHEAAQNLDQPGPSTSSSSSSRNQTSALTSIKRNKKRRYKKRKKRKPSIKITYEIDEVTGEKIAIQTKIKRKQKRRKTRKIRSQRDKARCAARAKTVKKRLAIRLGMCPPKVNQTLPEIRIQNNSSNIGLQRSQAGIPALHLFGQRHELDYFSHSDIEYEEAGSEAINVLIPRRPQLSDASILRRAARRKSLIAPEVTSTSNILDSILDSQSKFHSKNTVLSLKKDGTVIVENKNSSHNVENNLNLANRNANINRNRINLNNYNNAHARQTPMYGNTNGTNESIPIYNSTTNFIRRNSSENQTVSTSSTEAVGANRLNNDANIDPNYLTQAVCSSYDSESDNKKDKDKDKSRSNTPATHSDSEFDIYSDIETVSTSRAEESDIRAATSSPLRLGTPNTPTDEDANNSDVDLVIDTEKAESEKFDDSKEQVSSTVDSTGPAINKKETSSSHTPHSTSDEQHEVVQSSGQNDNRGSIKHIDKEDDDDDDDDNDEDSEDGCPNFSIYSTESIKLAKNTDLQLLNDNSLSGLPVQSVKSSDELKDKHKSYSNESENLVGTSVYSDMSFGINTLHNESTLARSEPSENALSSISDNEKENDKAEAEEVTSKACSKSENKSKYQVKMNTDKPVGLYSDSEDENLIKINHDKPFGIGDLRNMTEDISEEERSYTPCLDEKAPVYKQGLEGLETELISDEDRNDFDESHELKTISDGDALEINAKESELDFTKPEDYEEGEIVDKLKAKMAEEDSNKLNNKDKENGKDSEPKTDDRNKENEADNAIIKESSSFKKLSKNNKERNYRDKDKGDRENERSKSKEKKDKTDKEIKEKKKKEKRKELERYNVRSMIAEKPRRVTKDKFGRELRRRSDSKSSLSLTPPRRSLSRELRRSRSRSKKRRARSRPRRSATRSRSPERKRSRSPIAKKRRSLSRDKNKPRRKSRDRSKNKLPKENPVRHKSRSISPRRRRDFGSRRHSRGWSRSPSRSLSPDQRLTPSWTPPRLMETQTVRPRNLTVILNNDLNKKKKEKKKKEKRAKELEKSKRRKKDRTPPPSKEVFASGNNILVSVSFNKDTNERDVTKRKRDSCPDEISTKRTRKEKEKRKKDDRRKKRNQAISGLKPVAIIDLERSPFREIIPAAEDVIVLTDSENGESNDLLALQTAVCDSSQQVVSPERSVNANYLTGPKTPPEPQVKFSLTAKQPQLRAISNPLHEPDDLEGEIDPQEELEQRLNESLHKGPNTPPEPPNSPPSSPDVYDPFDPTKSRSPTPEPITQTVQSSTSQNDNTRDESLMDSRNDDDLSTLTDAKSHTPPVATDIQPADSQSNVKATTPEKSPEHQISVIINQVVQSQASIFPTVVSKSLPTFSTASSMITSTPLANLTAPRINIINSTIITPATVASAVPQRIVLPNTIKSSPVKVSPNKLPIKSTPIKPMPVKTLINKSSLPKQRKRNQENADVTLDFDSPYSPGSSDYEDLFEPPPDAGIKKPPPQQQQQQSQKNTKSPAKMQSAFDTLFGSSPVNPNFKKNNNKNEKSKHKKNMKGSKLVGVKIDEDTLKILDELPNSAVEMQVKDKYLKKLNRQERVVDEVKLVLKPHYNKKHINKEEYKDILRRAVPKICHNKSGEINPKKIQNLIEAYVKKIRHSKKVTSSSSSMNPQKA